MCNAKCRVAGSSNDRCGLEATVDKQPLSGEEETVALVKTMSLNGQQETLGPRRYYYAYADRRFCGVTDESNGYRKLVRSTIINRTDRCVRLITVRPTSEHARGES